MWEMVKAQALFGWAPVTLDFSQGKKWCAVQPDTAEEMNARPLCRGDKALVFFLRLTELFQLTNDKNGQ